MARKSERYILRIGADELREWRLAARVSGVSVAELVRHSVRARVDDLAGPTTSRGRGRTAP